MAHKNQRLISPTTPRSDVKQIGALLVGVTSNEISVDTSKLEAPSNLYDADAAWIRYRTGDVSIFFGKRDPLDSATLLTRIEVRYPVEAFLNTFVDQSVEFAKVLAKYCQRWPSLSNAIDDSAASMRAQKSHSAWASYTHMAYSGSEASIDFYHLSVASIARYSKLRDTAGLLLRPVMRVQLSTFDLYQLLMQGESVAEKIRKDAPVTAEATEVK